METTKETEVGIGDMAVLQIALSGVQHHIKKAIMMRAGGLCALIDAEVEKSLTTEKIHEAVRKQVQEEFDNSLRYGEGKSLIVKLVSKQVAETISRLSNDFTTSKTVKGE